MSDKLPFPPLPPDAPCWAAFARWVAELDAIMQTEAQGELAAESEDVAP